MCIGHFNIQCPKLRPRPNQTPIANPAPSRGTNYARGAANYNFVIGRVNLVAVEEAHDAPDVKLGMFLINATTVVVLFDSGASHFSYLLHTLKSIIYIYA
jgi:hypothetical protein